LGSITWSPRQQWSLIEILQVAGIHDLLGSTADNPTPTRPLELINSIYFERNHGIPECTTEPAVWVSPNYDGGGINEIVQGHDHRRQIDPLRDSHTTEVMSLQQVKALIFGQILHEAVHHWPSDALPKIMPTWQPRSQGG